MATFLTGWRSQRTRYSKTDYIYIYIDTLDKLDEHERAVGLDRETIRIGREVDLKPTKPLQAIGFGE